MGVVRKTISLPEDQDAWVKSQVSSGRFVNESEVHRSMVAAFRDAERRIDELRSAILAGFDSGYIDQNIDDIVSEIRSDAAKRRASDAD